MLGIRVWKVKSALTGALILTLLASLAPPARAFITDSGTHPPPTTGPHAYYATYGAFGPTLSSFPGIGGSYVDPVFGSTIRRLTNDVGRASNSENYAKNGYFNANGTLVHHRGPSTRQFINTVTGAVVRSGVPGTADGSFAPDDPDAWYWFTEGSANLMKYSVSAGTSVTVKTFSGALEDLGRSVDWIDRSGRYFVLKLSGSIRVWDKQTDTLFSGAIPGSYKGAGGWAGISPDGRWVLTTRDPKEHHSFAVDLVNRSVSTSGTLFWTLCGDHGDVVSATNGKTYLVTYNCASSPSLYAVDVSLAQSATNTTKQTTDNRKLVQLASWTDTNGHFAGVASGPLQDWAFADIESHDDTFTSSVASWRPYMQEILMMNVVTGEVRRLAHHRSRSIGTSYYYQPRISASWDGGLVGFISNMGYSGSNYSDLYVVAVPGGGSGGSAPPPPPSGAPSLAVGFSNPANGATVSDTVTVSVTTSGGTGSGRAYTVKAGTSTIYAGANAAFSWNTKTVGNGAMTLSATVTDDGGSVGSATRSLNVANQSTSGVSQGALLAAAQQYALKTWTAYNSWSMLPQYLKDDALAWAATSSTGGGAAPASTTGTADLASAQAFAAKTWTAYGSWAALPQYLKDEAFRLAPAGSGGGGATAATGTGDLAAAQAFAAKTWTAYGSWAALPQYLKDEAFNMAGGGGGGAVSAASSSGSYGNAEAFALKTWPAYGSWAALPQYLKDEAIAITGSGGVSSGGGGGGSLDAAKAFAKKTWPAYGSWETLPQYLKDEALKQVGG